MQSEETPEGEKLKEENAAPKESSCPEKPALPVKATVSLQIEKKGPVRTSERKHMPQKDAELTLLQKKTRRARKRKEVVSD